MAARKLPSSTAAPSRRGSRAREAQLAFEALSIEGGLLSPDWLARAAQLTAGGQSEADYRVPKGINLRDDIGRYWSIAKEHWKDFAAGRAGKADPRFLAERFIGALLMDSFGFASLAKAEPIVLAERSYPIGFAALGGRVPVVVAPAGSGLDTLAATFGDGVRRRSAFGLAQEYLNAADGAMWGLASDGITLRIVRDNASLTRPAWIEADLQRIFTEERYADFAALWLLAHESRFGRAGQPVAECSLETWRSAGREEGTRAREHLRRGVEDALMVLGQGFLAHPDNQALRAALQSGALSTKDYFNQLLRLVYRLIFLLTVEERGVLHPDGADTSVKRLYATGYSLKRLRERAVKRSAHDRFADLWEATKIAFRGLRGGESRLGLPALAGIFAQGQCPALDLAKLENRALLLAMFKLSWLREDSGLSRVNWRDMGPEELGSVYESLLELVPQITKDGRQFAFSRGGGTKGNARKITGSYYTPDSLVQVLLDSALEPVVKDVIAKHPENPVDALLGLSIVDPACGSGHFLLAAARRLASHVARLSANGTPSAAEYRHALRQVVSRCIYGVDLNPMAVELCKVSLWMEAVEPGLPLTFLNSHIQHGNALLGTTPELMAKGIPDAAWDSVEGDDKKIASALKKKNKVGDKVEYDLFASRPRIDEVQVVAQAVAELDAASDANPEALARKESQWDGILGSVEYRHQKLVADAWCAAFVWPKQPGELAEVAPTNELWRQLRDGQGQPSALTTKTIGDLAEQYHFFHWNLQFPQVVAKGGFDVVLGNPPWDTLSPDAKEFFAQFDGTVREMSPKDVERRIEELIANRAVHDAWTRYRREIFALVLFLKASGRFRLYAPGTLGKGDFNVYRMFVELALSVSRVGGFFAQVVPEGLYSGPNCMALRQELFDACQLQLVLGFVNTRHSWFEDVHASAKFAVYVARRGGSTTSFRAAFDLGSEARLEAALCGNSLLLPVATVREFSPDALAVMELTSQQDLDVARRMYSAWPPLGKRIDGGPNREFLRELETGHVQGVLTEDAKHLPHFEGRMIGQYDHRAKGYRSGRARSAVWEDLPFGSVSKSVQPQWYVPLDAVPAQAQKRVPQYRVAFCDVGSPSNERTLVASVIPPNSIGGANVPTVMIDSAEPVVDLLVWLASANSFVMDFIVRMKVSLHVSITILDSLPFPRLEVGDGLKGFLVPRVAALVCTGPEMTPLWSVLASTGWVPANTAGEVPGELDPEKRERLQREIDAFVAWELFGLQREEVAHVLDTFPIVEKRDRKAHGEYRTKRAILEIYDAMVQAESSTYQTRLHPAPADSLVAYPARFALPPMPAALTALPAAEDLARFVWAVVYANGGSVTRTTLARAYSLRRQPTVLRGLASAELALAAEGWSSAVGAFTTPASLVPLLADLESRGAVAFHVKEGKATVERGASTPTPTDVGAWHDFEARLVLEVLARLGAAQLAQVDAGLSDDARSILRIGAAG